MAKNGLNYREHVAAFAGSGMSKRAYCEMHDLKYANFMYYCLMERKRKNKNSASGFVEIMNSIKSGGVVRYYKPTGSYFEFEAGVQVELIERLCK